MSRVLILMYHAIDQPRSEKEARFCVPPGRFARQMQWLRESGYNPVSLDDVVMHVTSRRPVPSNSFAVTFDDGFADFYEKALPVLQEHHIPAALFAVSNLLSRSNEWMQQRGFPKRMILSEERLREVHSLGVTIGSHTMSHPRMTELTLFEAAHESRESKRKLEDIIGAQVNYFAYPYGIYAEETKTIVREAGYQAACSTRSGFNRRGEDLFALRRIDVFGGDSIWQFRQKLTYGINEASLLYPVKYYANRIISRLGP